MTQIMLPKLISPRHKCSIRHAGGLVQTGLSATSMVELAEIVGMTLREVRINFPESRFFGHLPAATVAALLGEDYERAAPL